MIYPNPKYFGYFDSPEQTVPAYDPGLNADCLVCCQPLSRPMVTPSLMPVGSDRSWFFRAHKGCWDNLSSEEQSVYESSLVDPLYEASK